MAKTERDKSSSERRQPNAIQRFIRETIGELRKVNWPSRQEATNLTIIVLTVMGIMSAFLGILDYFFSTLLELLLRGV